MFSFFQPIQTQEEIKQELNQKLAAFEVAMKNKDLDRVLSFFEKDGAYGQVKGRQEIKRVLKSYFNNEIISYTMRTDKITITHPLSNHTGIMTQEIVIMEFSALFGTRLTEIGQFNTSTLPRIIPIKARNTIQRTFNLFSQNISKRMFYFYQNIFHL